MEIERKDKQIKMQKDDIASLKAKYGSLWNDRSRNGENCHKCSVYANRLCSQCQDCQKCEDGATTECLKCQQIKAKLRSECSVCQNEFVLCDSKQVDGPTPEQTVDVEGEKDESKVIKKMKEIEESFDGWVKSKFTMLSLKVDGLKNKETDDVEKAEVNNFMSQFSG